MIGHELADVQERHRRWWRGHDGVTVVLAPPQHVGRGDAGRERRDLVVGIGDTTTSGHDLLRRDEVRAEDGLSQDVVRQLGREAADALDDPVLELTTTPDQALDGVLVGVHLDESTVTRVLDKTLELLLLRLGAVRRDRLSRHRLLLVGHYHPLWANDNCLGMRRVF